MRDLTADEQVWLGRVAEAIDFTPLLASIDEWRCGGDPVDPEEVRRDLQARLLTLDELEGLGFDDARRGAVLFRRLVELVDVLEADGPHAFTVAVLDEFARFGPP